MNKIEVVANKYFQVQKLKPLQLEIINNTLLGIDSLSLLPTGFGKSLCFQIPSLTMPGLSIVISPLLSLIYDQVKQLLSLGIAAAAWTSEKSTADRVLLLHQILKQKIKLLYLAPESLSNFALLKTLQKTSISQIAVDEAHCVSMWGHDFRPAYQEIGNFVKSLKKRPTISAFSATATRYVVRDCIDKLNLYKPIIHRLPSVRNNLALHIKQFTYVTEKNMQLLKIINHFRGKNGIIYVSTRESCRYLSSLLSRLGFEMSNILIFHAKLTKEQKNLLLNRFIAEDKLIVIATNAFGMGINKPNVRFVVHYQMPGSLAAYYQEVGRAGRDGSPSSCYLLVQVDDLTIQKNFIIHAPKDDRQVFQRKIIELRSLLKFINSKKCRMQFLSRYFGDYSSKCKACDNCLHEKEQRLQLPEEHQLRFNKLKILRKKLSNKLKPQLNFQTMRYFALANKPIKKPLLVPGIGRGFLKEWEQTLRSLNLTVPP